MGKKSKRARAFAELIGDVEFPAPLESAADLVKQGATAKFDESIDMDVRLGVDPRHADQMVRGSVALPHGTGRTVRVLVLTNEGLQADATEAGAEHVGLEDYIEKIKGGWTDVDVIIASPDVMAQVGQLGRVLGPRGLMPNPKSGTVTNDIKEAVTAVKAGKIDFRVDKYGILHASIARASFSSDQILDNARVFLKEVIRLRPASAKGMYVKSITMSSTMGPAIAVDPLETVSSLR
ncbi:MAG: 50S ribosomal protein L1 [Candidatus Latescibacterota bacterium]|jgi:large subunit ribosomal protein L1